MKRRTSWRQIASVGLLSVLLLLAFVPTLMMVTMSLRRSIEIFGNFWGTPYPPRFANYANAVRLLSVPTLNTLWVCVTSVAGILVLSMLSGYAFARLRFLGREFLFYLVLALMMVPAMLLLTPNYVLAMKLGLRDTYWGLWLFYVAGGQVFAIFLLRNFLQAIPEDLFESARIDGASERQCIWHIATPLSRPILVTVAIMVFLGLYNDLIWPMLILNDPDRETLMLALLHFNPIDRRVSNRPDLGVQAAGYVCASIPILIVFWFGMKSYIRGITSGAIKG